MEKVLTEADKRRNLYKAFCFVGTVMSISLMALNWQQSMTISRLSDESSHNSLAIEEIAHTNSQLVDKLEQLITDNKNLTLEFKKLREREEYWKDRR